MCAKCAEEADAGGKPEVRTFSLSGVVKPYWEWDRYTRPYVNGYWQGHTHADPSVQRIGSHRRRRLTTRRAGLGGIEFVWENDGGSGGSGARDRAGGAGSPAAPAPRAPRGASSRSSTRSGGSRRFRLPRTGDGVEPSVP